MHRSSASAVVDGPIALGLRVSWPESLVISARSSVAEPGLNFLAGSPPPEGLLTLGNLGSSPELSDELAFRDNHMTGITAFGKTSVGKSALVDSPFIDRIISFQRRVDTATILLGAAFLAAGVNFVPKTRAAPRRADIGMLFHLLRISDILHRTRQVREALTYQHTWPAEVMPLADRAFKMLAEATPAVQELLLLHDRDRTRALDELSVALDNEARQIEHSAKILSEVQTTPKSGPKAQPEDVPAVFGELLNQAGGAYSLTEASEVLEISRQGVYKRLKSLSMIGMMLGNELVIPKVQFLNANGKATIIPGLKGVLQLFETAGIWSALQFLMEIDPNLGYPPIDALRAGEASKVEHAAKAYLGLLDG